MVNPTWAEYKRPIKWSGNIYKIVDRYSKIYRTFSRQVCQPGVESKYYKLLRLYRGQGYYLPKVKGDIDRKAIKKNMHHFPKKIAYIDSMIKRLEKTKKLKKFAHIHIELDKIVTNLLNIKKKYYQALTKETKEQLLQESRLELIRFKKQFDIFLDHMFFMKSYGFPNNYLRNRRDFEKHKFASGISNKKKANEIFFYRRLTEDGAYDPNKTRPDKFIRTTLDTLYLNIQNEKDFISENVRYDLDWIERRLEKFMARGKTVQLKRLREWKQRTQENYKFYQDIIQVKNEKKAKFIVQKENDAALKLKEFVYKKQAEVYEFWAKQPLLMKALFSMETILMHEVGVIDGSHGLERTSVGMVVLNRVNHPFYSKLEKSQSIYKYIDKDKVDVDEENWLNTLFKVGEFSFTYHYIPAVKEIFCPDMSRRGRGIRKNQVKIALRAMKYHDGSFRALRYFSRISMLGKIDMSTVWTEYERVPEMPGLEATHQKNLTRYYLADKYQYYYSFIDERNVRYTVVRIKDTTYAMRWKKGKPQFFHYRNPHLFAYFNKKE